MIEELFNEETTNERSANKVCIFTNELDGIQELSGKSEKASIQDCKGSGSQEIQQGESLTASFG